MYYNTSNNTYDLNSHNPYDLNNNIDINVHIKLDDYRTYDFIGNNFMKNKRRYHDPCENCPNNPLNNPFSSGFCNCALPALMNPIF